MDLDLLESFYRRAGGEIDYSQASFGEYDDGDSRRTYDTAMIRNGELNGLRRYIWRDDEITTRTYKDGEWHGLAIWVESNDILVYVHREGTSIFRLWFYPSGQETYRGGSEKNSFTDVTPEMFLI